MATQNNKKMLHKKEPQMLGLSLVNSSAGSFIVKDPLGIRRTALLVSSATVQRLYDINEDGWQELPSFALADLDSQTLNDLCDQFRDEVFRKAGKSPPNNEIRS